MIIKLSCNNFKKKKKIVQGNCKILCVCVCVFYQCTNLSFYYILYNLSFLMTILKKITGAPLILVEESYSHSRSLVDLDFLGFTKTFWANMHAYLELFWHAAWSIVSTIFLNVFVMNTGFHLSRNCQTETEYMEFQIKVGNLGSRSRI